MRRTASERRTAGGFTLIELIVVMMIIAILAAGITPMFRDSMVELKNRRVVSDMLATMKYAQERAIADGREYRFCVDPVDGRYWVEQFTKRIGSDKRFAPVTEGLLRPARLPDNARFAQVEAQSIPGTRAKQISFYPSGSCDFASFTVLIGRERVTVDTKGRVGQLKVRT